MTQMNRTLLKLIKVIQISNKKILGFILASVIVSHPEPHGGGEEIYHVKISIGN